MYELLQYMLIILSFDFFCQYGRTDNDKAATTPLVKHAPAPAPEKGKKGKKDAKKDKLDDLKQELEMVHSIKMFILSILTKLFTCPL